MFRRGVPWRAGKLDLTETVNPKDVDMLPDRTSEAGDAAVPFGAAADEEAPALQRRLTRVALDLHDGTLQDVAALLADVRFFRTRVEAAGEEPIQSDLVVGLLDDFEARLIHVDDRLRSLIRGEHVTSAAGETVWQALEEQVSTFGERTGIHSKVELTGDLEGLTTSQAIALFRIVQTALANVARHSGAEHVEVRVGRGAGTIDVEVLDDGQGFDFDEALLQAVREGRLGLAGIAERVRLLGGDVAVESSTAAGGTRISIHLPEWPNPSG
jgi:signal transduction histidine kinase